MKIALVSDVFPPKCGGSGWSSFYLAQALRRRGHNVWVVVPREGERFGEGQREYEGLEITEFVYPASQIPFVRNYSRNERLYPRFAAFLSEFFRQHGIEVAHGQHYLTIPPTVMAAERAGIPSLATVRDYWPVCYWTTQLSGARVCPGCSESNRLKCLPANQGLAGLAAAPLSLYMGANLKLKQHWLARADAVLAVSHYIATKLAPFVEAARMHIVPNFIDLAALEQEAAPLPTTAGTTEPFLFFVGKLEANKGAGQLLELLRRAKPGLPTLVAGEGALQAEMERLALAEAQVKGLNVRFLGWLEHAEVLRLMKRAELLLFPSLWPEPLSRVLLEATALGTLVLAQDTGGTADIIRAGETGLLVGDMSQMAERLTMILAPAQAAERAQLRASARRYAAAHFSESTVIAQVEKLYQTLLAQKRVGHPASTF